jgi:phospholipase C
MADPIQHIVCLLMENRSFDQMLGCFSGVYHDLDGIDPLQQRTNALGPGSPANRKQVFEQSPTHDRQMPWREPNVWDPHHEVPHVHTQIEGPEGRPQRMSGFVADFAKAYPDSTDEARQYVMGYYPLDFLPALHALGRNFLICDRWFSSLPGPTWPNRFVALSGTASGRVDMPGDGTYHIDIPGYFHQKQPTIFDRLNEKGINWKSYFHSLPQSWALRRARLPQNIARFFYIDEFFEDAREEAQYFPQFCYIEPDLLGFQQNDDHPPHDVMKGEKLIADVYNALRGNTELWQSTLLVVYFDEHGGFYDHVYPPSAVPPDPPQQPRHELLSERLARLNPWHRPPETYSFKQLGVRVPALLVSPWVKAGVAKIDGASPIFDHTSVLRYLTEKWDLGPLGLRTPQSNSIGSLISDTVRPDTDTIARIDMPALQPVDPELEDAAFGITEHDKGLLQLATYLKVALWVEPGAYAGEALFEFAPRMIVAFCRPFETILFPLICAWRWLISLIPGKVNRPRASVGEPDKIHTDTASPRDDITWFLMRRKQQALPVIARQMKLGGVIRDHAARTLAVLTNRPFHKEGYGGKPGHERAREWLARHRVSSFRRTRG